LADGIAHVVGNAGGRIAAETVPDQDDVVEVFVFGQTVGYRRMYSLPQEQTTSHQPSTSDCTKRVCVRDRRVANPRKLWPCWNF
jgi:hypothetical protein